MAKDIPSKESVAIPLFINGIGFILLWLTSMRICSAIDAILFFSIILFTTHGIHYGGIHTLFGFAGIVITLMVAIYGYNKLYFGLELNQSEITPLWGQFLCFLTILLGVWIVWYLLSRFFLQWQKVGLKTPVAGGILGFSKGVVITYLFFTMILSSKLLESHPLSSSELEKSWFVNKIKIISPDDYLNKIDLIVRFQKFHFEKKIQWIAENLSDDDNRLKVRIADFLNWLALNPDSAEKWIFHPEAQKYLDKMLQIPEAKKYWVEEEYLQKLKQKKLVSIDELCYLLQKINSSKLAKNPSMKELLQSINFEKIKSGI